MVTKTRKPSAEETAVADLADTVKNSAQQIWLAGLGAYAKAQEEGGKVFDALVKEGHELQKKTQAAAEEKISEATGRVADMASELSARTSGKWDKLETMFEDGVARALNRMGMPAARDMAALQARIDELNLTIKNMSSRRAVPSKAPAKAAAKTVAKKVVKKTAAAKRPTARPSP